MAGCWRRSPGNIASTAILMLLACEYWDEGREGRRKGRERRENEEGTGERRENEEGTGEKGE